MRRWMILAFASCLAAKAVAAEEVRLAVQEPTGVQRQQWPVTSGIPLAQGALRDAQGAALFDAAGRELPLQTETLARWSDGSVRWLLLDFLVDLNAKETKTLILKFGSEIRRAAVPNPVRVTRAEDGKVTIEPGPVRLEYDPQKYYLTGDRRALKVAIQMADAMVRHCPTAYSDHIRGLGWPIVLVLNAYEATGDKKYLDAATACWQVLKKNLDWQRGWVVQLAKGHCVHPERICYGNVPFMEGLLVSALARYHRSTQDPEVLRAITVGVDQMLRECWVEEDKAFRYTACPLSTPRTYISVCLAAEGMAYEGRLTGNGEHLRVLREGLREMLRKTGSGDGKSLAQLIHFTPYALRALDEE